MSRLLKFGLGGAGDPPPSGTWMTNAEQATMAGTQNGWVGYTLVVRIEAAQLSNTGGSKIRLSLRGGLTEGAAATDCFVGMAAAAGDAYDFEGTPTQITVGGSNGFTVPATTVVVTDEINFTVQAGKALLIATYFGSGAADNTAAFNSAVTGWTMFYKDSGATESATVNKTGYTTDAASVTWVTKVESFV